MVFRVTTLHCPFERLSTSLTWVEYLPDVQNALMTLTMGPLEKR